MHYTPSSPKLNLLSLPAFTTIFFALIALVIWGAAAASLAPLSRAPWQFFLLPLVLLPLRDFLHWPDREKRARKLRPPEGDEQVLQHVVNEFSAQAGMHPPQVWVDEASDQVHAFGTFRRGFIAIGAPLAAELAQALHGDEKRAQRARALLAHELAHFANRDMQRAAFARSLLRMTLFVMGLNLFMAHGRLHN